jgi:hypothetical protein
MGFAFRRRLSWATSLAAAVILAGGCSESAVETPSRPSTAAGNAPAVSEAERAGLSGTMQEWTAAVCELMPLEELPRHPYVMPRALGSILHCVSKQAIAGNYYGINVGFYESETDADLDLTMLDGTPVGPYARGWDPARQRVVMFALSQSHAPERALTPLSRFGFVLRPSVLGAPPSGRLPSAAPPVPAPPPRTKDGLDTQHLRFRSPTGAIACDMFGTSDGGSASCEVAGNTYPKQVMPQCAPNRVTRFELIRGHRVELYCYDQPTLDDQRSVQRYGQPLSVGSITCVIDRTTGVTCSDSTTGHAFRASRDAWAFQ